MIGRILRTVRTPVTLLILLAILIYAAYWGYANVMRAAPAAAPDPCVTQSLAKRQLMSSQVVTKVFNGGDSKGLAANVARSLRAKNFWVSGTTNTIEKINQTVIVGANAKDPEVIMVAAFFKGATIRADQRADHTVDVLVGNKYGGFNKDAKTTLAVATDTLCLPSVASASPSAAS